MEFYCSYVLAFLTFAMVASSAALTPELYWSSALPNNPMPKAIRDLLHPDLVYDKSTAVDVGNGGVGVDDPSSGTNVGVGNGGVGVSTQHKGRPVFVGVTPGPNPFDYQYAATQNQIHDNPNVALFFIEKDLIPTHTMNLHFTSPVVRSTFLPRKIASKIPFSSKKLSEIFSWFSVKPGSNEAEIVKNTIRECEAKRVKGEEKLCATSLESMIDFVRSKLGNNVATISTETQNQGAEIKQMYRITGIKKVESDKSVVCHKQNYAYAVFYCHATGTTRAYMVRLLGANGAKVRAAVVCHTDTSAWNPKHLAFQVLKIKPGTVAVCHFLPQDHIVWVSKY